MGRVYTQLAVDNFQRADENPLTATKWTLTTNGASSNLQIKSHVAVSTVVGGSPTPSSMYYTGAVLPNDQYAEMTLGPMATTGILELIARSATTAATGYLFEQVKQADGSVTLALTGGAIPLQIIGSFPGMVGDVVRVECLGQAITFLYNGLVVYSVKDSGNASGVATIGAFPASAPTDTGLIHFAAGSITSSGPSLGTVLGSFNGTSVATAFANPGNLDILQVVNEGGQVIWSLTGAGIASSNPTTFTSKAILGQFEGQFFNTAFPTNSGQLDILQIRGPGGALTFRIDFLGNALTL